MTIQEYNKKYKKTSSLNDYINKYYNKKEDNKKSVAKSALSLTNLVGQGALRTLEAPLDIATQVAGGVAGLFGAKDTSKALGEAANVDLTSMLINYLGGKETNPYITQNKNIFNKQELNKGSYITDENIGGQIVQALGQVGGTASLSALASVPSKTAKLLGAIQGASSGVNEAFSDTGTLGAKELGYGTLQGLSSALLEGEKIPGIGNIKGSLLKRFLQEGGEEAAQDLITPLLQTLYKGGDSLSQYSDEETYKNALISGLVGGVAGGITELPGYLKSKTTSNKISMDKRYENVKNIEKKAQEKAKESLKIQELPELPKTVSKEKIESKKQELPKTVSKEKIESKKQELPKTVSKEKIESKKQELPKTVSKEKIESKKSFEEQQKELAEKYLKEGKITKEEYSATTEKKIEKKPVRKEVDEVDETDEQTLAFEKEEKQRIKQAKEKAKEEARKEKEELKKQKEQDTKVSKINSLMRDYKSTKNVDSLKKAMDLEKEYGIPLLSSPKEEYKKYLNKKIYDIRNKKTEVPTKNIKSEIDKVEIKSRLKNEPDFEKFKEELSKPFSERFKNDTLLNMSRRLHSNPSYKEDLTNLKNKSIELFRKDEEYKVVDANKKEFETIEDMEKYIEESEPKVMFVDDEVLAKKELEVQKALKENSKDANKLYQEYKDMGGDMSKKELVDTQLESIVDDEEEKHLTTKTFETIKETRQKLQTALNEDLNTRTYVNKETALKEGKALGKDAKEFAAYLSNKIENNIQTDYKDIAALTEALKTVEDQETLDELVSSAVLTVGENARSLSLWGHLMKSINNTPKGKELSISKTLKSIENDKRFKVDGDLSLTEEDVKKLHDVKKDKNGKYDQKEMDKVTTEIINEKLEKVKGTTFEKLKAWRKFAMLTSPKTHIRNIFSNIASKEMLKVSNMQSGIIQDLIEKNIINKGEYFTSTRAKATQEVSDYSTNIANEEMSNMISKYTEDIGPQFKNIFGKDKFYDWNEKVKTISADKSKSRKEKLQEIQKITRDVGKGGAKFADYLQTTINANYYLMAMEDSAFKKKIYSGALSTYLTANGITTQAQIDENPNFIKTAKEYAMNVAEYGTFQQASKTSDMLNILKSKDNVLGKVLDIMFPFTKTPVNILSETIDYSPIGLTKAILKGSMDLKNGKITTTKYIDGLTKGMTGSMVYVMGALLSSLGILKGKASDEDKELGIQDYSINIDGNSYTIDWLTPTAMPLVWGAVSEELMNENASVEDVVNSIYEPFSNMTVLNSFSNLLTSYNYDGAYGVAKTLASNYASQYIPTISSNIAKTIDNVDRQVGGNPISAMLNKIPFATYILDPKLDVYGNEVVRSSNVVRRAYDAFIAPYTKKTINTTPIVSELQNVYNETKNDKVLTPSVTSKTIKYNDETYEIKDSIKYKKTYGSTVSNTLTSLFDSQIYKNSSTEDKTKLIENVYSYAKEVAKKEALNDNGIEYTNRKEDDEEYYEVPAIVYAINKNITLKAAQYYRENPDRFDTIASVTDYETYKQYEDEIDNARSSYTKTSDKKQITIQYINSIKGLNKNQKAILYKIYYPSYVSMNSSIYNYIKNLDISVDEKNSILQYLKIIKKS